MTELEVLIQIRSIGISIVGLLLVGLFVKLYQLAVEGKI